MVASQGVPAIEARIFEGINGLPDALYPAVWPIMQAGSLPGALSVAALLGAATRRLSVAACTGGAVLSTWLVAKGVKDLVGRGRPFGEGLEVVLRDQGTYGLGYVSGHAALAAAAYAMAIPHLRGGWRPTALLVGLMVGFGRIYSGAHLPLDVIGGGALGLLIGEAFRLLEVRWRSGRLPRAEELVGGDEPVAT